MLSALQVLRDEYAFTVDVIDVDADNSLIEQFDELVPVLFGAKDGEPARQLCHYFLDESKVRLFLSLG